MDALGDDKVTLEQLRIGSENNMAISPEETRDHVCMCTSDPKIPRPRNGKQASLMSSSVFPIVTSSTSPSLFSSHLGASTKMSGLDLPGFRQVLDSSPGIAR